jgi:hypothetical protein
MTKQLAIQHGGEWMRADVFGRVSRPGIGMGASGQWVITGAVRLNNFGYVVERFTLAQLFEQKIQWRFKNGKQRVHVCDLDHGTHRVWMNPTHSIQAIEE